ncbi:MAG: hypothetical protein COU67_00195 [Candidatus Pacebacteria bacterium CG10_big_fil_rev_8_21_14_0_10_44_54]|nr:MAG: hypothetical protein COU67_00195 [Candidatus Pacebacteria bacterium CG10_big_fil_rev_8_21_14_0_10_44_54]
MGDAAPNGVLRYIRHMNTVESLRIPEREGVLAVFIGPQRELIIVPSAKENAGKVERVLGDKSEMLAIGNKFEAVSGGMDEADNGSYGKALVRKLLEERSLSIEGSQIQLLPMNVPVLQKNGGEPSLYRVQIGIIRLTADQIKELGQKKIVVPDGEVRNFVKNDESKLRPSLVYILNALVQNGELR